MRKSIFFFLAFVAVLFASCELESPDNGDLDGFWHLTSVDSLQTGGNAEVSKQLIFWSVQGSLLDITQSTTGADYIFRFTYQDNTLSLYDARINDRRKNDSLVTDVTELLPYGITSLTPRYTVEKLSGSKMILSNDTLRLSFTKF
ncbi:MAG: lipocalin-like domain-containing protein [Prevotella sp.]|jgi:hypothetical protein